MHIPIQIRIVVVVLALVLAGGVAPAQESLNPLLQPYLAAYEIPALAAAVVQDGQVIAVGAVGTRRWGTQIPVTLNDRFHLGSDTKAMTATMAAILVERGKLRWDSTIGEVFPELGDEADPVFKVLTVERMLSHTSGLPSDNLSKDAKSYLDFLTNMDGCPPGNLDDIRAWLVGKWAALPMPGRPGVRFEYSNLNYTIVGAMIERLAGRSWDELIVEWIFEPLELRTAGPSPCSSAGWTPSRTPSSTGRSSRCSPVPWRGQLAGDRSGGDRPHVGARFCALGKLERRPGSAARDREAGNPEEAPHHGCRDAAGQDALYRHAAVGPVCLRLGRDETGQLPQSGHLPRRLQRYEHRPDPVRSAADFAVVILTNIATPKCDGALKVLTRELIADKYAGRSPGRLLNRSRRRDAEARPPVAQPFFPLVFRRNLLYAARSRNGGRSATFNQEKEP